jgi:hypothetical protein
LSVGRGPDPGSFFFTNFRLTLPPLTFSRLGFGELALFLGEQTEQDLAAAFVGFPGQQTLVVLDIEMGDRPIHRARSVAVVSTDLKV